MGKFGGDYTVNLNDGTLGALGWIDRWWNDRQSRSDKLDQYGLHMYIYRRC